MTQEEVNNEIERLRNLLGLYFFIHDRIYDKSKNGLISYKDARIVLMQHHNIPKTECPVIFSGMEILGLITKEGESFIIKKPNSSHEKIILEYKKKLGLV